MALNFPDSPSNGDQTTLGGLSFTYNSTKTVWEVSAGSTVAPAIVDSSGTPTFATGITEAEIKTLLNIGAPGKVLQVVSVTKTDTFTTTSETMVDITNLSQAITLSNASNKVLVLFNLSLGSMDDNFGYYNLVRGTTDIYIGDAASNRLRTTGMFYPPRSSISNGGNEGITEQMSAQYLDTPGSVGPHTYKIQVRCATAGTITVNRSYRYNDGTTYDPTTPSSITLMEISA